MNYLKQPNWWDCAPVALINSLIFLGHRVNKKHQYKQFSKMLKVKENFGTKQKNFDKLVRSIFPFNKPLRNPSIEDLNRPCILGIDADWCHVGLLIKITKHYVYLVNWGADYPLIRKVKKDTLKKWLNRRAIAYFIA